MPLYFFNVRNHVQTEDLVGVNLIDLRAARREAVKDIADIINSKSDAIGHRWQEFSIEICDPDRKVLLVVPFSVN